MLEAIISAGDASTYLRMTQLVPTLLSLATKRLESIKERHQWESHNMLEKRVGIRKVRSFRIIRFRDAEPRDYNRTDTISSKRENCKRGVLLRIWDYDEKKEDSQFNLREGDHYRVSSKTRKEQDIKLERWRDGETLTLFNDFGFLQVTNLKPTKVHAWPKPDEYDDIHLSTGYNSEWALVGKAAKVEG